MTVAEAALARMKKVVMTMMTVRFMQYSAYSRICRITEVGFLVWLERRMDGAGGDALWESMAEMRPVYPCQ
jgi:hypothetical protein